MPWVCLFDERDGVSIVNVNVISDISACSRGLELMYDLAAYAPFSLVNVGKRTLIVLGTPDEVALDIADQCDALGDLADSYAMRVDIVLHRRTKRMEELKESAKAEEAANEVS